MIFIKKNNSGKFLLLTLLLHFILSEIDDNMCIYLWKKCNNSTKYTFHYRYTSPLTCKKIRIVLLKKMLKKLVYIRINTVRGSIAV